MSGYSEHALNRLLALYLPRGIQGGWLDENAPDADRLLRRLAEDPSWVNAARLTVGSAPGAAAATDREALARFVNEHLRRTLAVQASRSPGRMPLPPKVAKEAEPVPEEDSYVHVKVVDDETDEPLAGVEVWVKLPDGKKEKATTNGDGLVDIQKVKKGLFTLGADLGEVKLNEVLDLVYWGLTPTDRGPEAIQPEEVLKDGKRNRLLKVERHRVRSDETLDSVAKQHGLTWQQLAKFNWGKADADGVNKALPAAVGCTKKTKDGKNYVFSDSDEPGILYIPKAWEKGGLDTGIHHTVRVRPVKPQVERLVSRLALEQLTAMAKRMEEPLFLSWLLVLFGPDIPESAYKALRKDLLDAKVEPPPVRVVVLGMQGHEALYDNEAAFIRVRQAFARASEKEAGDAAKLMIALVEEFGHHLDHLLRHTYSKVGGDAPLDEGARFAHGLFVEWLEKEGPLEFATYTHDGEDHPLSVDAAEARGKAEVWLSEAQQSDQDRDGFVEFFGAGRGHGDPYSSFGHESVEDALAAYFSDKDRTLIYFGNWLRDYSQVIDPKLVRAPDSKNPLEGFSRKALTDVVDILGRNKFGDEPQFRIDPAKLGLYRADEHIDNPHGIEDGRKKDPGFHSGCTPAEVAVDPRTGMLNYIATPGAWKTAAGFMEQELRAAVAMGHTAEGMRHFGQALHTLEDFYAHSNFVELACIRAGFTQVCPWVWKKVAARTPRYPLVTGKFGGDDTQVSLLYVIAEKMQEAKDYKPGERGSGLKIAFILMRDQPTLIKPSIVNKLDGVFRNIEQFEKDYPWFAQAVHWVLEALFGWYNQLLGYFARKRAKAITEAQDEHLRNPASTNPTHSQIAKDHDDHPLHTLAARLAQIALRDVGAVMRDAWLGKKTANDVVAAARKYLVHPEDIQTGDSLWHLIFFVKNWLKAHPEVLPRLTKAAITKNRAEHHHEHAALLKNKFDERTGTTEMLAQRFDALGDAGTGGVA